MSEQDSTQASTKRRRSHQTGKLNSTQVTLQRPTNDDKEAWKAYWKSLDQPWRTEPEIDVNRQKFLTERRGITPSIEKGIYPFKGIEPKLTRADIESLLATHANGRGPVDWNDQKSLHERRGLDLRGADLHKLNLTALPLSCMRGSLNQEERKLTTAEQCKIAVVHMEAALLVKTHFERADLSAAHLKGSHMREAHLEYIDIRRAQLEGAELENVSLSDEKHIGPRVVDANWSNVNLSVIKWSQVSMLGDEYQARQKKPYSKGTDSDLRLNEYEQAARANHQLAVVLEAQGLNEIAARFAYRAQVLQRSVFGLQMLQRGVTIRQRIQAFGVWLFSWFLYLLAGFGYRPGRTFISYLIVNSLVMSTRHERSMMGKEP